MDTHFLYDSCGAESEAAGCQHLGNLSVASVKGFVLPMPLVCSSRYSPNNLYTAYKNPKSRENDRPKPLDIAHNSIILHTFGGSGIPSFPPKP